MTLTGQAWQAMTRHEEHLRPSRTAAVLVNHGRAGLTLDCLDALARLDAPPGRIVVVDNGSPDGSVQVLSRAFQAWPAPPVPELLALEDNLGFGGGNNAALRLLRKDADILAYWLLNNDALPARDALERLCGRMNLPDRPGACGSVLLHPGTPARIQCAGGGSLNRLTGTSRFALEGVSLADARIDRGNVERGLDYLCAASLLVRREAVERAGLLDEDYFLYYEDVAWSLRMRRRGVALGLAEDSLVTHLEGGSTGAKSRGEGRPPPRPAMVDYLSLRNRVRLAARFFPLHLPCVAASFAGVLFKRAQRGQADRFGLVLRALWDGLAGNMGPPPAPWGAGRQP